MSTRDTWDFINTFAGWFSAIGTFAAVAVSLYLAMRDSRIHLRVNAGIWRIFGSGNPEIDDKDLVLIAVVNVGRRTAKITGIFWRNVLTRGVYLRQNPGESPWSAQIPAKVEDGDEVNFTVRLDTFAKNDAKQFERLIPPPRWITSRFVKVQVRTTTGDVFSARLEKELRAWLMRWIEGHPKPP